MYSAALLESNKNHNVSGETLNHVWNYLLLLNNYLLQTKMIQNDTKIFHVAYLLSEFQ